MSKKKNFKRKSCDSGKTFTSKWDSTSPTCSHLPDDTVTSKDAVEKQTKKREKNVSKLVTKEKQSNYKLKKQKRRRRTTNKSSSSSSTRSSSSSRKRKNLNCWKTFSISTKKIFADLEGAEYSAEIRG